MAITNASTGTNVHEIADGIYRINTPVAIVPGGFSFNQYLVIDDQPLLFHTGPRKMFPLVLEAVESIIPASRLRYIALSHFEADECGSINEWLAAAPHAVPLCSQVAAMVSVDDFADRPAHAMADSAELDDKQGVATYKGNVIITQGSMKITGNTVTITRNATGDGQHDVSPRREAGNRGLRHRPPVVRQGTGA